MSNKSNLIFIVGNSRSGTTMLGRILNQHSEIYTFHELHFFEQLVSSSDLGQQNNWSREKSVKLLERLLTSARDGYFSPVVEGKYNTVANEQISKGKSDNPGNVYEFFLHNEARLNGKKIPCEQTPRYLFSVDDILMHYPNAKIINMVRDPRAVLLSQKNKWKRRFLGAKNIPFFEAVRAWTNYHPVVISKLWSASVRQATHYQNEPRFKTVQFENILLKPQEVVSEICDFLNVHFEKNMIHIPNVGSSLVTDSLKKIGMDNSKINSWKKNGLTETELSICQSITSREMGLFGYIDQKTNSSLIKIIFAYITVFFKLSFSVLLNLKRNKNIFSSIKKRLKV